MPVMLWIKNIEGIQRKPQKTKPKPEQQSNLPDFVDSSSSARPADVRMTHFFPLIWYRP